MNILRKIWPVCLIIGFILVFFGKKIFPAGGNFIGGIDVAQYFLWNAQFIKEQLLSGHLPLWNPYYYSGHPFIANPQTFVFYPATLLYITLPLPWAFNIDTFLHIYLAALGMYCFVLLITESKNASLASAIIYGLNGYFMNRICSGNTTMVHTAALLPWVFYFFEKGFKTGQTGFFIITGIVFGLHILSGEPQNSYYTLLFLMIYTLIRYAFTPRSENYHFLRPAMFLALIMLIAFGISAVQILPSFEFMSLSDRAEKTYQFATAYSFPPENFFTFLTPSIANSSINPDGEAGYIGIMSLILSMTGVIFYRPRPYIWCFRIMPIIAVTIMLGKYTPLYHLYYLFLPGISLFRIPARCMVIFVFSLATLSGFGVKHLCRISLPKSFPTSVIILWFLLLICLFAGTEYFEIPLVSNEILITSAFLAVSFIILILSGFIKNKSVLAGLIITVLFADLYLVYHPQIPVINQDKVFEKQPFEYEFANDHGLYRVASPLDALLGANFHYYGVNAYTPLALESYFRFMHETANVPIMKETRHSLNPQIFHRNSVFSSKILNIKYALVKDSAEFELITSDKVMPRAVLVNDAVIVPDHKDQLQYIKRPDFDPQRQVLLDSNLPQDIQLNAKGTKSGIVTIAKYQPNRIELSCVSDSNTCLVLSELFYPGWKAYLNGNKVQILKADYMLRAISLPAGKHNIVFVYRPMSLLIGGVITILTTILIAVFYFTRKTTKTGVTQKMKVES